MYRSLLLASVAALTAVSAPALAKPAVPTIEQLAASPKMTSFDLSPDGKHLVAVENKGEDSFILVWDMANLKAPPTTIGSKAMKIRRASFVKNDVIAVTLWQTYDAKFDGITKLFLTKVFFTDLQGKDWREPIPVPRARTEVEEKANATSVPSVLDDLPNDPDHVLMINDVGNRAGDIFKVNVRTMRTEKVQRSGEETSGYVTDLEGNIRARIKFGVTGTSAGSVITTQFRNANGSWEDHFQSKVKDRDVFSVVGFTADPNIAIVLSNVGEDKRGLYEYNIATRKVQEPLFRHKFFEAEGVEIAKSKTSPNHQFGDIISIYYQGPTDKESVIISPFYKAIDASIRKSLNIVKTPVAIVDPATGEKATASIDAGLTYELISASKDGKTLVFTTSGPNSPPSHYLLKDGTLTLLAKEFPEIDARSLGTSSFVYYKARDGLDIPAFLTKPNPELCGPGPWPAVVHPHGGPWGRDNLEWDWSMWTQLMASRCKAVLQPQFRGSSDWGRKLWKAGDAEWGQKMQDDKDDGAKWMIEQKIAIPGRMAMFGFSYGGYSSMVAAIRPNGLYKCAISGAGVSDIKRIWKDFYDNPYFRDNQKDTVDGLNPVEHADKIQIPIMVYVGDRDQTTPMEQSDWYVSKAKKSGQQVEYHKLADYAHGPAWTRATFGKQLKLIDDWFTTGCGGGGL